MKAIETQYKGYRFRSRLEARWAVFFDALGIRWEYEPEGFELGFGERYLPDFFLRISDADAARRGWEGKGYGYWVEIKAEKPTADEIRKLEAVCRSTQHHGYLFYGAPGANPWRSISYDSPPPCAVVDAFLQRFGDPMFVLENHLDLAAIVSMCANGPSDLASVKAAIAAARGARFEFGESGAAQ
ncbi:hypothetical protein QZM89_07470 [Burkholderia gladioli]|uniref:hypothetical protein n=1 Tax=Burkholderia gladioli TaxID=28095 RepID=UPI0026568B94|nr:hypothetical protein [Burkholderia gladioli]MDN7495021.1 hypothetical protein [Burkholderia gladioli]